MRWLYVFGNSIDDLSVSASQMAKRQNGIVVWVDLICKSANAVMKSFPRLKLEQPMAFVNSSR